MTVFLAALLMLSAAVPPAGADERTFPDAIGHWAGRDIAEAVRQGLAAGYPDGTFRPDGTVTRAEFVKLAVLSRGLAPVPGDGSFSDLNRHWLSEQGYVQAAVDAGLIVPPDYGRDRVFDPDKPITRLEVAVIASRVLGRQGANWSLRGAPLPFSDASRIPHWASGSVAVARSAGVLGGYPDGSFGGDRTITRAEAVVVAIRLATRQGQTEVPVWEANSWQVETVPGVSRRDSFGPSAVAADPDGTVYVRQGPDIWKVPPGAPPSLLHQTRLRHGSAFAASADGLFLAEGHQVWRVMADGRSSVWAGGEEPGDADGQGDAARFRYIQAICAAPGGKLYVVESSPGRIREISAGREVRTLVVENPASPGYPRPVDGPAGEATVSLPSNCAVDPEGSLYFVDNYPGRVIRRMAPDGSISWYAGYRWWFGYGDGTREEARFTNIAGLALDGWGNLWIAELSSNRIRRISPDGHVHTVAGSGFDLNPYGGLMWAGGDVDGPGPAAKLNNLSGIALAGGKLYVTQNDGALLRVISGSTSVYDTSDAIGFVPLVFGNRIEKPEALPLPADPAPLPVAFYTPVVRTYLTVNGSLVYQSPPDEGGAPPPLSPLWKASSQVVRDRNQLQLLADLPVSGRTIHSTVVTGVTE